MRRKSLQVLNVATLEAPPKEVTPQVDEKIRVGINGEATALELLPRLEVPPLT